MRPEERVVGSVDPSVARQEASDLLRAAATLVGAGTSLRVLLVGDGPLRGALQEEARGLGLGDRLVLTGVREDVPRLLAAMDVFALPSHTEGM